MGGRPDSREPLLDAIVGPVSYTSSGSSAEHLSAQANVVAVINPLSGERSAAVQVFATLRRIFNHRLLVLEDGDFRSPSRIVEFITKHCGREDAVAGARGTVLVGGGDGTMSYFVNTVAPLITPRPTIAVLPLGTGNDFSNALGLGQGYQQHKYCACCCCCPNSATESVYRALGGIVAQIDRWEVKLFLGELDSAALASVAPMKRVLVNNYFTIGIDALITQYFDKMRRSAPSLFKYRVTNKFFYGLATVAGAVASKRVDGRMTVHVDGVERTIPSRSRAFVISNLNSYASGTKIWTDPKVPSGDHSPRFNDGLVEVSAVGGMWHLAFMQLRVCHGDNIAQGKEVVIRFPAGVSHCLQVDGEPLGVIPGPVTIQVSLEPSVAYVRSLRDG